MIKRFDEYCKVRDSLTLKAIANAKDFAAWQLSWDNYVKDGGDRPPKVPPNG